MSGNTESDAGSGLLTKTPGDNDVREILKVSEDVAAVCLELYSEDWGFHCEVSTASAIACANDGSVLFSKGGSFSFPPGPFKRVAALVVLARIHELFKFTGEYKPVQPRYMQAWQARIDSMLIPAALYTLNAQIGDKTVLLDGWKGFPSNHFKLEFLAWLKWLDICDRHKAKFRDDESEWQEFRTQRLARMVMGCALMLESAYYLGESTPKPDALQRQDGPCLKKLNREELLDFYFDEELSGSWHDSGAPFAASATTANGSFAASPVPFVTPDTK